METSSLVTASTTTLRERRLCKATAEADAKREKGAEAKFGLSRPLSGTPDGWKTTGF
jgi:hypothetical protein